MMETLELFDETINNTYFKDKQIILFLNKTDVFKRKIATKDLNVTFPEYDGGCDFNAALEFIKAKFIAANKHSKDRLKIHTSCATNKEDIDKVMTTVKKELIATTK